MDKILRDLREEKQMNQTQVAEIIGTTQKVYSRYETGERTLPLNHIITLAKYYDVSLDYICGVSKTKKQFPKE